MVRSGLKTRAQYLKKLLTYKAFHAIIKPSKEREEVLIMYFYEIKCRCDYDDWYKYFYVTSPFGLRSLKDVTTNKIPNKARLVIEDHYLHPIKIRNMNAIEYFYDKYFKKDFHLGNRINWEKENI